MTTEKSKTVDKITRMRAAYIAAQIKENVVVYEMKYNQGQKRTCPLSLFETRKDNPDVVFFATIDEDGNYVD